VAIVLPNSPQIFANEELILPLSESTLRTNSCLFGEINSGRTARVEHADLGNELVLAVLRPFARLGLSPHFALNRHFGRQWRCARDDIP
jgi:hypothetical protein